MTNVEFRGGRQDGQIAQVGEVRAGEELRIPIVGTPTWELYVVESDNKAHYRGFCNRAPLGGYSQAQGAELDSIVKKLGEPLKELSAFFEAAGSTTVVIGKLVIRDF